MPGVKYEIGLDNSQFMQSANAATSSVTNIGGSASMAFAGIGGAVTAATAALGLLRSAIAPIGDLLKESISESSDRESLEASFEPLLGGVANAKKRMAELSKFAATTPFQLDGVAKASKVLETLTDGMMSTGKGLRLIGDAASLNGGDIEGMSVTIGRLYAALQNGRPMGEPMQRMAELGLIGDATRAKLEDLQAEGAKGEAVWQVAAGALDRFSGSMARQADTFGGKMSNLKEAWVNVLLAFGNPITNALKPYLDELVVSFADFTPVFTELGATIGAWIEKAASATSGVIKGVMNAVQILMQAYSQGTLGALAQQGLEIAFKSAVNTLWAGLNGCISAIGQLVVEQIKEYIFMFSVLCRPEFWVGMGKVLLGIFVQIASYLQEFVGNLIKRIPWLADKGKSMVSGSKRLRTDAEELKRMGTQNLAPVYEDFEKHQMEKRKQIIDAFNDGYNSTNPLMEVKPVIDSFTESISKLDKAVQTKNEERKLDAKRNAPTDTKKALAPVAEIMQKLKTITFQMAGASSLASVGGGGYGRMVQETKDVAKQQLSEAKKANNLLQKIAAKSTGKAVFA